MGQEIPTSLFTNHDFDRFFAKLKQETMLLENWFKSSRFCTEICLVGYELEAWLVYKNALPAPINEAFINRLNSELVTPELSKFNIELNNLPVALSNKALSGLEDDLHENWQECIKVANAFNIDLAMIGILPSLGEKDLTMANMSEMQRYHALNQQVLIMRQGLPLKLDICGQDHLRTQHHDVMLEASTTSFQVHLQFDPQRAVRYYNASLIVSAMTLAVSANSPYLFGHDLWDETRIPLFEQAVDVAGYDDAVLGPVRRVSFGSSYVKQSIFECFNENLLAHPIMLPIMFEGETEQMHHLRLHNGTIWRWNRPLIGFNPDGSPSLRLEHRVIPGGPTIIDMIANATFYLGLVHYMATMDTAPESQISFAQAKDNFYKAARNSLKAEVYWLNNRHVLIRELVLSELIPMAKIGLHSLGLDKVDIEQYMQILEERVHSGQTGAVWQRGFVQKYGHDMNILTKAYIERQKSAEPVHTWSL